MCRKHRINCQTVKQNNKFIGLITSLKLFYCSYLRNNEVLTVCILQIISKIITFSLLVYLKCYVTIIYALIKISLQVKYPLYVISCCNITLSFLVELVIIH